ncbi:MAG: glycosyl hydrolase, partial [Vicinamibacterales bacterium]
MSFAAAVVLAASGALAWPAPVPENRPWTRWWWLGSAVDEASLTRELELFRAAGIGGVEICPIYGVQGWEARNVPFLSPRWVELVGHTLGEARRLGMVVDLTTGTGWPFGGPWVVDADASSRAEVVRREVVDGTLSESLPAGRWPYLLAVSPSGERFDLTSRVGGDGRLDWTGAAGSWRLYGLVAQGPVQKVKRAAPGGEGSVLDPYSTEALGRYLEHFDQPLASLRAGKPRAHFHDSFEYYGATFTPRLLEEFQARRGYDLRGVIEALAGDGDPETLARVRSDYRETLADLHLEYVRRWTGWAHAKGSLSRNQAHGSPGDLLDLYAAADIPETEVFRRMDEKMIARLKLASSAAHLTGGRLASAEAFTWLGEHFATPLASVKQAADWLYLAGVNHLLFHGVPHSPAGEPWPGVQFYASVNFGPSGGLWRDLPAMNGYLTRVQSVLQSGEPDEDVLLFYSPHDAWSEPPAAGARSEVLAPPNPVPAAFEETGHALWRRGYQWDAVSERRLDDVRVESGAMRLGAGRYRALVLPRTRLMTPRAARRIAALARDGVSVVLLGGPPRDVPGHAALEARRAELREALSGLASAGERVLEGDDLDSLLGRTAVAREPMADAGLQLVRRRHDSGRHYFVVNRGQADYDGWLPLATPARAAALLDPLASDRTGTASLRVTSGGKAEVRLQLPAGDSVVVRTFEGRDVSGAAWSYVENAGPATTLAGMWSVSFVEGGPELPASFESSELGSWTTRGDEAARRFAGTAKYALSFERPALAASDWLLDLGDVRESARVRLNGRELATLWSRPYRLRLGSALTPGRNRLEVEVTNLPANRVRDLDERGVRWKRFHDINVVNLDYKPFDASAWPLRDSGLLGPVTLA